MNHSPAYILAQYLINEGLVIDPQDSGDWPVYVGMLPDDENVKDNIVACMDTEPLKDGRIFEDGENIWHYGFQTLVRAVRYNTAYEKAEELAENLETVNRDEITISSSTYRIDNVSQTTGAVSLGQEDGSRRRQLFSTNFLVTLKEI